MYKHYNSVMQSFILQTIIIGSEYFIPLILFTTNLLYYNQCLWTVILNNNKQVKSFFIRILNEIACDVYLLQEKHNDKVCFANLAAFIASAKEARFNIKTESKQLVSKTNRMLLTLTH